MVEVNYLTISLDEAPENEIVITEIDLDNKLEINLYPED